MLNKVFRRRPLIEELEPRILFSADLAPFALDSLAPSPEQRVINTEGEFSSAATTTRNELVIIDSGVEDYETLLADILKQADSDRHFNVVILDTHRDGIEQITTALQQHSQLDALHLITHGEPGSLQIGSSRLDAVNLAAHAADITNWSQSFGSHADLLLYGCDVASGSAGDPFIHALSQLTGTDVAASTDKSGAATQGGDWLLEKQTGAIESSLLLGLTQSVWQGQLDVAVAPGQSPANTTTANDQFTTPSSRQLAINPTDGSFVMVWTSKSQDGDGQGVYLRRFDASGAPLTAEIRVNTEAAKHQQNPAIAMDSSGNFVVVWESQNQDGNGYGIHAQRFHANTTPDGAEMQVNTTTSDHQTAPSVAMDADGDFVVAWASGNEDGDGQGVYARRFDAATGWGTAFQANTATAQDQDEPAVAMNAYGAFVIVWTSRDQDGSGDGVYGRLFDAAGATVKSEFRINVLTFGNQYAADVAINDAGAFVVALSDDLLGNPNIDVFAFDAAGNRNGFGILANQTTSDIQQNPAVAIGSNGDFIVAWESKNQDGDNFGIVARHFRANYSAYGAEQIINVETANAQSAPSLVWNGSQVVFVWSGNSLADSQGVSFRLAAINSAPVITSDGGLNTASVSIAEHATFVTTVTASDPDVPAQTLTYSVIGGADQSRFSIDAGTGALSFITAPNYEVPVDANGDNVYEVLVQVSDGSLSDTQAIHVTITDVNEAPIAGADLYSVNQNTTLTVPIATGLLANDSDPEGDALAVVLTSAPSHGSLSGVSSDGAFTYTPTAGYSGPDSFSYTVSDSNGHTSVAVVSINISLVNSAPTTTPVTLTPIAEDSAPRLITQAELLANAGDANGDSLVATGLAISGGNGGLLNNGDGTWSYSPAINDDSSVSFSYFVFDGSLATAGSATLDITPLNDAPTAADTSISATEDAVYNGNLPVAGDVDGDTPSYALNIQANHGTVAVNPDGSFSYTSNANFNGTDDFRYTVSDGNGGSNTYVVTIDVATVNDAPTTTSVTLASIAEDGGARLITQVELLANTNDVDGDSLTATSLAIASGSGTLVDNSDGTWAYTPAPNDDTSVSFSYVVTDGLLTAAGSASLDITPENDAPLATNVTFGTPEDTVLNDTLPAASDVEGDSLTYSLNSAASNGTATVNPDGSFSYTPNANFSGSDSFSYTVSDGNGGTDTATVSVTVNPVNDAPSITTSSTPNVAEAKPASVLVTASDVDGDTLSFTISGGADAALFSIDPASGLLSLNGVPHFEAPLDANGDNIYEVIVTVSDGHGGTVNQTINLVVFNVVEAAAPAAEPPPKTEATPDEPPDTQDPPKESAESLAPAPAHNTAIQHENSSPQEEEASGLKDGADYNAAIRTAQAELINLARNTTGTTSAPMLASLNQALGSLAGNARALQALQASLNNGSFLQQLDQLQDTIRQQLNLDKNVVASTLAVSTGLSVGYVLWLVRGGVLLSSLLTSLPAWRLIDPLPILGHLAGKKTDDEESEDDSLESMLKKSNEKIEPVLNDTNEVTP